MWQIIRHCKCGAGQGALGVVVPVLEYATNQQVQCKKCRSITDGPAVKIVFPNGAVGWWPTPWMAQLPNIDLDEEHRNELCELKEDLERMLVRRLAERLAREIPKIQRKPKQ